MFNFVKQPAEETTRAVDFSGAAEIQGGETITSATVTVTLNGTSVPAMLVSSVIDGNLVKFRVKGGNDRQDYKVTVQATTSAAHIREADIVMNVRDF